MRLCFLGNSEKLHLGSLTHMAASTRLEEERHQEASWHGRGKAHEASALGKEEATKESWDWKKQSSPGKGKPIGYPIPNEHPWDHINSIFMDLVGCKGWIHGRWGRGWENDVIIISPPTYYKNNNFYDSIIIVGDQIYSFSRQCLLSSGWLDHAPGCSVTASAEQGLELYLSFSPVCISFS